MAMAWEASLGSSDVLGGERDGGEVVDLAGPVEEQPLLLVASASLHAPDQEGEPDRHRRAGARQARPRAPATGWRVP